MVNYSDGKIYKLVCNLTGLIYIGSTCEQILLRRLATHVIDYKRYVNGKKHFISSYLVLEHNDYDIVLIESVPCNTKDELYKRERYHIENTDCVNCNIPTRTNKEYYIDNKDKIHQYYIDHKEYIQQRIKKYYLDHVKFNVKKNSK